MNAREIARSVGTAGTGQRFRRLPTAVDRLFPTYLAGAIAYSVLATLWSTVLMLLLMVLHIPGAEVVVGPIATLLLVAGLTAYAWAQERIRMGAPWWALVIQEATLLLLFRGSLYLIDSLWDYWLSR